MGTKEKIGKKLDNIEVELIERISVVEDFDDEKEIENFSEEFGIDTEITENIFMALTQYKKDKKELQMLKYIAKYSSSGVNFRDDIKQAKEKIKASEKVYDKALKDAEFEIFIAEIPAEKVGKNVIGYLKDNEASEKVIKEAVNKYASEIKLDSKNNENVLKFLYENEYEPNDKNEVDIAYKYFLENKIKEQNIKNLELEMVEIEEVIHRNINTIKALNKKLSYYEEALPNVQAEIKECAEKAKNSISNVKEIQKQVEMREHKGFFKRMFRKVKFFFKKDKPLLLSESLSGLQSEISAVTNSLLRVENTFAQPVAVENENVVQSI